jgi:hypothetical protein
MKNVVLMETALPRSWIAKSDNKFWHKEKNENLNEFRWRIMRELDEGCIFIFE